MNNKPNPILAIECTTTCGSVAIVDNSGILASHALRSKVNHSIRMLPVIEQILNETEMQVTDLAAIAVSQGPGSFTGVRIGISTAKGLAKGANIPLIGIPTLEALAQQNSSTGNSLICPMIDARRQNIFTALYKTSDSSQITEIINPCIISLEELLAQIESPTIFTGNGAIAYWDTIQQTLGDTALQADLNKIQPSATAIAALAHTRLSAGKTDSTHTLQPIYLRQTNAKPAKSRIQT